jgi:phosphoribosyl-ATP pyrophosphohydrolase
MSTLDELYATIQERKENPKEGSYTTYLFEKGLDKILKKVGEEATEVVIAAKNENEELIAETSDLVFHTLVLLVEKGITLDDIAAKLEEREGKQSRIHDRKPIEDL